jgi:proprotein convertase subtilisin/kexin type 5
MTTFVCDYCLLNCVSCTSKTYCDECKDTYVLSSDKTSCNLINCPSGQYLTSKLSQNTILCDDCPLNCIYCTDSTHCTTCQTNYYLSYNKSLCILEGCTKGNSNFVFGEY